MRQLLLGLPFVVVVGCGATALQVAERALSAADTAWDETNTAVVTGYGLASEREARRIRDEEGTFEDYERVMAPWSRAVDASAVAQGSIQAAWKAHDAWASGDEGRWLSAAGCVFEALAALRDAAEVVGISIPSALSDALVAMAHLAGFLCEEVEA